MSSAEQSLIELCLKHQTLQRSDVWCHSGDDAAGMSPRSGEGIVTTVDAQIEGTHFDKRFTAQAIGHRSLAVSLSDIAAMGAQPCWAMASLSLPIDDSKWLSEWSQGFIRLAEQYDIECVGGNLSKGARAIHTTLIGQVNPTHALHQHTAQMGDDIYITGRLGASAWALNHPLGASSIEQSAYQQWQYPNPPVNFAQAAAPWIHACLDISDGLIEDLTRLLKRSLCAATIDLDACPYHPVLNTLSSQEAINAALLGGEVYELCFTAPQSHASMLKDLAQQHQCQLSLIGEIQPGSGLYWQQGSRRPIPQGAAFEHFKSN